MTNKELQTIEAYRATGRLVFIRKRRKTGRVEVSLSGGRATDMQTALDRMRRVLEAESAQV